MQKNRITPITGERILDYIPQRPPVVLVDAFYGIDQEGSHSGYTVEAGHLFCRGGVLDECALIEHMAQSAALRAGYLAVSRGKRVPLGFIGAVDRCTVIRRPEAGERLRTIVRVVAEVMNVTLAEAEIRVEGEKIGECRLKIVIPEDIP